APVARSGSPSPSLVSVASGSGVNLLKIGSITTGEAKTSSAEKATIAPEAGIHQRRGDRRISRIATAAPPAAIAPLIAVDFARSVAHEPQLCVDRPTSRARCSAT